jgi:hypothetical protein
LRDVQVVWSGGVLDRGVFRLKPDYLSPAQDYEQLVLALRAQHDVDEHRHGALAICDASRG